MTAPPREANLVIPKGVTWRRVWTLTDPETNDPFDLTGWAVVGQVRAWYGSGTVLYEWSDTEGNVTANAQGEIEIVVPPADSTAWEFWEAIYDLEASKDGQVYRIAAGTLAVSPEVTQGATP